MILEKGKTHYFDQMAELDSYSKGLGSAVETVHVPAHTHTHTHNNSST